MLRRGCCLLSSCAIVLGPTGCLSDHCAVYREQCVEIAESTETSDTAGTSDGTDPSDGTSEQCGDGIVQGTEACDDGNTSELDTCTTLCTVPQQPTFELTFSQVKQFEFDWAPVLGAHYYRVLERADVDAEFVQIGADVVGESVAFTMPLHFRLHASYKLLACDADACLESAVVDVVGNLAEAVGYFKALNTGETDYFGSSVALSDDGNTLVVGAFGDDSHATGIDGNGADNGAPSSGAVHVFVRTGVTWSQQAYVKASSTDSNDSFGTAVALSDDGNTLVVGAPGEDSNATGIGGDDTNNSRIDSGAAYVFVRNGGTWSQQSYVKAFQSDDHATFGIRLALSDDGNTLAVGGREDDHEKGIVHVFVRSGDVWSQQTHQMAFNADDKDLFGDSLALSSDGDTLAIGAPGEDSNAIGIGGNPDNDTSPNSGAVYLFVRNNGVWSQQAYVKASNPGNDAAFGTSVALSDDGDTLAVGAWGESSSALHSGAVYIFTRGGVDWSQQAYVKASNPGNEDSFGQSVALSNDGNILAVGADREQSSAIGIGGDQTDDSLLDAGSVYVFLRSDGNWSQEAYVKASNSGDNDRLGWKGLALSGDGNTLAVGAYWEAGGSTGISGNQADNSAMNAGAVYLY